MVLVDLDDCPAMTDRKYVCQECGCLCESCVNNNSLHLHREIEVLRQQVLDRDYHIVQMDTRVLSEAQHLSHGGSQGDQVLRDELRYWQDKYNRLLESHRKLQKVNQSLEDKLLKIVDKYETEKSSLTRDITDLSSKLVTARYSIAELEEETEQYRNDCNVAVHLLQCKPSSYLAHKFTSLPSDLQEKVKSHFKFKVPSDRGDPPQKKTISVPIPTFPPTAVVYSVNKVPQVTAREESNAMDTSPDFVSAAIMAKVLEERAKERTNRQNCRCGSRRDSLHCSQHKSTQTTVCCNIHSRQRSESASSTDSSGFRTRQPSTASTETII